MTELKGLRPERVFWYFEKLCEIPHGSENMQKISDFVLEFAKTHSLRAVRDGANNVIIFKKAARGYENCDPVILQGHMDMVCQKTEECTTDFLTDGIEAFVQGDFIKARGTSLGADNGIAVAMMLAVLEDEGLLHPAIEAVFTTDEEIGMIGANRLDTSVLSGKRLINLDSEEDDTVTVSCAGGSDFEMTLAVTGKAQKGIGASVCIKGLKGGHSGVDINKSRINANILLGRVLNHLKDFEIISINGGDKANAIPRAASAILCVNDRDSFYKEALQYLSLLKEEISDKEPDFEFCIDFSKEKEYSVFDADTKEAVISALLLAPNGVQDMSVNIEGLVETSLNLGILKTVDDSVLMNFALRSNKISALKFLEDKLRAFSKILGFSAKTFGHYPPWEFKKNSTLLKIYEECYKKQNGRAPKVEAIHAGLECGVFSSKIAGLECIAIGPTMFDVHTPNERLSISSTQRTFELVLKILESIK